MARKQFQQKRMPRSAAGSIQRKNQRKSRGDGQAALSMTKRGLDKAVTNVVHMVERLPEEQQGPAADYVLRRLRTTLEARMRGDPAGRRSWLNGLVFPSGDGLDATPVSLTIRAAADVVRSNGGALPLVTGQPRMTTRDAEVARLRDEEQLPWKAITRVIRENPDWADGCRGKRVTKGALRTAYCRRKAALRSAHQAERMPA